jgi:hypothetical protein
MRNAFFAALRPAGILSLVVALQAPGSAATTVQVPGSYTLSLDGSGLTLTNTFSASTTQARPVSFTGIATGSRGIGILGQASGLNGTAGRFELTGSGNATGAALVGNNGAGSTTTNGAYGNAGLFQQTNAHNTSPGVGIQTNGIDSYGLRVINTSFTDFNITHQPSGDNGGIAGYFEINSPNAQFGETGVLGINSGGETGNGQNGRYGNAGAFVITNTNNFDSALLGKTTSVQGTGVEGDDFSNGSGGGVAVFGVSTHGLSAVFTGGSGGSGTCSYDGSAGWTCPSDRNLKDHFVVADTRTILERLEAMPVYYYQMRGARLPLRYLGPTAQDFKAAFALGGDDTKINTANEQGVALAAIKGLYEKLQQDEAKMATQDARIATLERRLSIR